MFFLDETIEVLQNKKYVIDEVIESIDNSCRHGYISTRYPVDVCRGFSLIGFFYYETSSTGKEPKCVAPHHKLLPILMRQFNGLCGLEIVYLSPNSGMKVHGGVSTPSLLHLALPLEEVKEECLEKLLKAMELHYCQGVPLKDVNPDAARGFLI